MTAHQQIIPFVLSSFGEDIASRPEWSQTCLRCGHSWIRIFPEIPRLCPKCRRAKWSVPKDAPKYKRPRRHDLLGKTFGRWTVIDTATPVGPRTRWVCKCICGTIKTVWTNSLTRGHSTSCGCRLREVSSLKKLRPYEGLYKSLLDCSIERSIKVCITYEEFLRFTEIAECHYCGLPIVWNMYAGRGKGNARSYNLDRIDSSGSYSIENCVVCCKRCNWAKLHLFTYSEWVEVGNLIRSWRYK